MKPLEHVLKDICPVDSAVFEAVSRRLDNLTKPKKSLGRLEEFAMRIAGIQLREEPEIKEKIIFTFAGDHGVSDEAVSAFPKEVTCQMVLNFLRGGAGINVLARHVGARVIVIDIGVDGGFDDLNGLVKRKVIRGTRNMKKGPAMTRQEALKCIEVGLELAHEYAVTGAIFGTGEMGIANSTAASAMLAVFSGLPAVEVTGKGTGIDEHVFRHKVKVIEESLLLNAPDPDDPLDVLS
ncbi:MAG: nicotinate-nucleotide--dimethylbenzimidazole phosphoribosyltransferase, partial [Deltaproteobacteria bacterium]|nr:nicotinate-nucleotide--dimethylbenzimidazole phosphoribosyltransferase [Deltaproteobacteria bacterium]